MIDRLSTLYNSAMGADQRDQVEEWAKRLYPTIWTEVSYLGKLQHESGHYLIKMPKRVIKA